ncbi:MAG: O-methyltransferase [Bacteroidetes bacterium]|nr:O-methyltransferase [Bacteroidota bacterium]
MTITPRQIDEYCEKHSSSPGALLYQLERETHLKTLAPQMLSGSLQGQFMRFISLMLQPKRVLEIGTFTGYGALCLAEGLPKDGELHTIEANQELYHLIEKYISEAGKEDQIKLLKGDAREIIPTLDGPYDLIFVDAGKQDYPWYYEQALPLLRKGGWLLADNVLWSGKVASDISDPDTDQIRAFNAVIQKDSRVENVMLPLRDGLSIIRKL